MSNPFTAEELAEKRKAVNKTVQRINTEGDGIFDHTKKHYDEARFLDTIEEHDKRILSQKEQIEKLKSQLRFVHGERMENLSRNTGLVEERNTLSAEVDEAVGLMVENEWVLHEGDSGLFCPECEMSREEGHKSDCRRAAFLAAHKTLETGDAK